MGSPPHGRAVALPFFDRYGHPAGLRQLRQERVAAAPHDRVNPRDLRCLAATAVIPGRGITPR